MSYLRKIQKIPDLCKKEMQKNYNFCKVHPISCLLITLGASIFVYAPVHPLISIAPAIGLAVTGIKFIDFEENSRFRKTKRNAYELTSIPLPLQVIDWAKEEAESQGISYKSVISEALLKIARR